MKYLKGVYGVFGLICVVSTVFCEADDAPLNIRYKAHIVSAFSPEYIKSSKTLEASRYTFETTVNYWSSGDKYAIDYTRSDKNGVAWMSYRGAYNGRVMQVLDRPQSTLIISRQSSYQCAFLYNIDCLIHPLVFNVTPANPVEYCPISLKRWLSLVGNSAALIATNLSTEINGWKCKNYDFTTKENYRYRLQIPVNSTIPVKYECVDQNGRTEGSFLASELGSVNGIPYVKSGEVIVYLDGLKVRSDKYVIQSIEAGMPIDSTVFDISPQLATKLYDIDFRLMDED